MKTTDSIIKGDPTMEQLVPERDTNPGTRLAVDVCNSSAVQENLSKGVILSEENLKAQHR
jgi:hypothetical protein